MAGTRQRFGAITVVYSVKTGEVSGGTEFGRLTRQLKGAMLKLLCITAHPDDEAGAFGGTLLLYGERGVETSVVCLTAGTAAKNRGSARTNEELAQLRTAEFTASCNFLGVSLCEVLNYPDSQLDRANFFEVVGELVARIRTIRPHVVLTFGTDGGLTGHPDHAMAGAFATQAFQWAGRPDRYPEQLGQGLAPHRAQKLYYCTADFVLPDRMPLAPFTVTARVEVGRDRFEKKNQAFRLHTTQAPLFDRLRKNLGKMPTQEMFHLAATRTPRDAKFETDLFEDVIDE
jgi:LmbE family N-acetylglucosaminyl deacetylase